MNLKRFVIEMGTGIDQHGQDVTKADTRAVEDAVRRICLARLQEVVKVNSAQDVLTDVLIACPNPQAVKTDEVLRALPFGRKQIRVVEGGMLAPVTFEPRIGDRTAEAVVANAAITVSVDMDRVLESWKRE